MSKYIALDDMGLLIRCFNFIFSLFQYIIILQVYVDFTLKTHRIL